MVDMLDSIIWNKIREKPNRGHEQFIQTIIQEYNVLLKDLPEKKTVKDKISVMKQKKSNICFFFLMILGFSRSKIL